MECHSVEKSLFSSRRQVQPKQIKHYFKYSLIKSCDSNLFRFNTHGRPITYRGILTLKKQWVFKSND